MTPAIHELRATLGTNYRIRIKDGRTFVGQFLCVDPQGNIVLDCAIEYVGQALEGRDVGMVLVPQRWWDSVERESGANDTCLTT